MYQGCVCVRLRACFLSGIDKWQLTDEAGLEAQTENVHAGA